MVSQWKQKLSRMQISWPALAAITVVLVIATVMAVSAIQRSTAKTRSERSEKQLQLYEKESERDALQLAVNNVGSDEYINMAARNANMQSVSSIRFRVVNPDELDKYTEEEWQIILEEQEWDAP